nr:MFS transporter [Oculatella sp. LEGE 06141]
MPELLQASSRQVWVQAIGRSLYQAGYGVIQFYVPLIFVNQVGLSATAVGIGIGSGSLAGVLGHLLGGYLADSQAYGRKRTLLISAGLSILSALFFVETQTLPLLVIANLLLGLSAGCYWTAADAAVIDVTSSEQRHKAFAVMVLADSLGGGLGILGGGVLLAMAAQIHVLFLGTTVLFLLFLLLVLLAVVETRQDDVERVQPLQGFVKALKDRSLQLFVLVNILFTTYIALVNSTLPLYFTNVMSETASETVSGAASGTTLVSVANLFTWCYVGIGAVLQWPLVQGLNSVLRVRVLMLSMLLWCIGFCLVWAAGFVTSMPLISMVAAFGLLSIATAIYKPFAPAIVAELAPKSSRGIYLAISYQCWSIGYFVGPIVGGWAMDQSHPIADYAWMVASASTLFGLVILYFLGQRRRSTHTTPAADDTVSVM